MLILTYCFFGLCNFVSFWFEWYALYSTLATLRRRNHGAHYRVLQDVVSDGSDGFGSQSLLRACLNECLS